MRSTITDAQQQSIADLLVGMKLPVGTGDERSACSIAAINLALSGRLTDDIPDCMSDVVGRWIIHAQDVMPEQMRNSQRWKELLPRAAGTGKLHERKRFAIILDWMWDTVLPTLQLMADNGGFGAEWLKMTTERTAESSRAAAEAAEAVAEAEEVVAVAARAARAADAAWAADAAAWERFDPCGVLQRLVEVSE